LAAVHPVTDAVSPAVVTRASSPTAIPPPSVVIETPTGDTAAAGVVEAAPTPLALPLHSSNNHVDASDLV